jgi:hypothetical protein
MNWKISILNKPNQMILVKYEPKNDKIRFIGQFKPRGKEWEDFCEEEHELDIDLSAIQDILIKIYKNLQKKIEVYNNLNEGLPFLKEVEFNND